MENRLQQLYNSCLQAGYACAEQSFENVFAAWKEERNLDIPKLSIPELIGAYGAWIGFPSKDNVIVNFADQSSEYLYGGNQADVIDIDPDIFPEFNGNNHWAVLDKYFGKESAEIVQKAFQEGLEQFLAEHYGNLKNTPVQRLVCISENFPLVIEFPIICYSIEDLDKDTIDEDEDIIQVLCDNLEEFVIPKAIDAISRPLGIINSYELSDELVETIIRYITSETQGSLFLRREGYVDEPIPNVWLGDWVREYFEDSSVCYSYAGEVIMRCVTDFLNEGTWHLDYDESNRPFLWFGPMGSDPIDIWSLPYISEDMDDSWQDIWFNDTGSLDWHAILDDPETLTYWMFMEKGLEEPTDEFDRVIDSCPIHLTEEDTTESIVEKINALAKTQ